MSRFFRSTSDSESETDSDISQYSSEEEFSDGSDEEEQQQQQQEEDEPKKSRFLKGGDDSDSDDESSVKRQVKSLKDKRLEGLFVSVKAIENGQKNNDWGLIASEFDKLNLTVSKVTTGFNAVSTPKAYIKVVAEIDDSLKEAKEKNGKKNSTNIKAMNNVKQKMKKITKQYEDLIAEYRKNPEEFMIEEEEEVEVEEKAPKVKAADKQETKTAGEDGFSQVGKSGKVIAEITQENLFARLKEVLESRGKKNTNRQEQLNVLEALLKNAITPFQKISVLQVLLASRFDVSVALGDCMKVSTWKSAAQELNELLNILETTSFVIREDVDEYDNDEKDIVPEPGQIVQLRGSIISYTDRLDEDYTKSLQSIDPHSVEYIDRLRDEPTLYNILVRTQIYYEGLNIQKGVARMIMRRLEHVYFKPEQVILATESQVPNTMKSSIITAKENPSELVNQLCSYLYKHDVSVLRTRAILCHIYHYALHDQFHTARDMLLMSHLQESVHQADHATQILYNRTMVQIGLCAFRQGLIKECQVSLQEIQGTGRVKELLAQGVSQTRFGQAAPEPEVVVVEQRQLLPYHMHINLELLECVFLVCSMLLEIPAQAQAGTSNSKKFISRPFRRLLDYNERQAFTGPPENTRDHIMSAAKALASGEWEKARDFILAIKIWDLMPNNEKIKKMLVDKIQEEGLRTYLFTYASYYSTVSIAQLATMFDLSQVQVNAIVAKMIFSEELSASLDQVSQCVVLHQIELSKLQLAALQYSEKVSGFVEQNERLLNIGRENNNAATATKTH
ncbi:eukaryotic translation initiation factor 3 subunit 8 N-terminus-domain-containing protein [Thamnidium elegans]|uniref:Eukaryotic translation initiation factor 3 subunit C n=1 Tax=Thamnidium elegans TaxID=101142 RepID=A0A8H7SZU5_9FUNG|nr:hypothetical protein INT48_006642 [Thamnidium elegans]KAI8077069.1 eukaryotic translation initiation factor 3 subunit 8 N-terminus-domain-containing protein [Thamnidium elegans]